MIVKYKENLNSPLKGWPVLSAIYSMVFHSVQCDLTGQEASEVKTMSRTEIDEYLLYLKNIINEKYVCFFMGRLFVEWLALLCHYCLVKCIVYLLK